MIRLDSVRIEIVQSDKTRTLIRDFTYQFKEGQCYAVIGPNGAGKSALIRSLLEPNRLTSGSIRERPQLSRITYIPQDYRRALFPWLSVEKNIALHLGEGSEKQQQILDWLMDAFMWSCDLRLKAKHLSGGECQMLLMALSLVKQSKLNLLDEPFSALDQTRKAYALKAIRNHTAQSNSTSILIVHDIHYSYGYFDHYIFLSGQGGILKVASSCDINKPSELERFMSNV